LTVKRHGLVLYEFDIVCSSLPAGTKPRDGVEIFLASCGVCCCLVFPALITESCTLMVDANILFKERAKHVFYAAEDNYRNATS
jgi:hypothetical protein